MSKIKGDLARNGIVITKDVEFTIITQESHGKRTTVGTFNLPANVKIDFESFDLMFDVILQDGRRGSIAIAKRIFQGNTQHFSFSALGL